MRKGWTLFATIAVAVVCAGGVGCAGSSSYPGVEAAPEAWTTVEVTNNNWSDVKVYALRGASKFRLGSVNSFSTQRLRVPAVAVATNELRLRVEIIGSRAAYTTEPFLIGSGATISWVINAHLPLSRVAIHR